MANSINDTTNARLRKKLTASQTRARLGRPNRQNRQDLVDEEQVMHNESHCDATVLMDSQQLRDASVHWLQLAQSQHICDTSLH